MAEEMDEKEAVVEGVHNYSRADRYVPPKEEAVKEHLEWFQDQKLALMMHWGVYSQWGIVESWALSDEDGDWSRDCVDWNVDGETFKKQYFDLNKTFNPVRFEPEKWAEEAANGGFKYIVFTTKHHDGFCMWDTKVSDYRITAPDCPFHTHKNSDVCKVLFDAARKKGLGIAAYFSKADWHIPSYWKNQGERSYRGPAYDPSKEPEKWEEFVKFTHDQIRELTSDYGKIDVLWFDAGWVCKENGEDIRLGEIVDEVRKKQPWLLSADRTVGGPYENYVTPEQCVPDEPLGIPWESCITMGTSFSFKYEDKYKTPRELALLLMDIVVKGGNLALNVGPQPDGRLPEGAIASMRGLGAWLKVFGEGIYGTRVCAPYKKDGIYFTQKKAENLIFAFKMYENETDVAEKEFNIPLDADIKKVTRLEDGENVEFVKTGTGYRFICGTEAEGHPIATAFRIQV
ncbi:MAG: alpha-L-fucosidase [Lachnospiraceae bacterium]|nr:alpha-L-fucosidase [Lachnospiraceae bacterium]